MPQIIFSAIFLLLLIVSGTEASAKVALLQCEIEGKSTVVKIEKPLFGGKKVYFNTRGDWVKREVYKQNDEYIWVRSDFSYQTDHTNSCITNTYDFDFLIELIEKKRGDRIYVDIHRITDHYCTTLVYGNCEILDDEDRLESIRCKVEQPFK